MKKWLIFLVLGMLSGCASNPIELPSWDIPDASEDIQRPLRLPELPPPASASEDTVTFTREDFAALTRYAIVAGGNYEIAEANAEALERQSAAYNKMREAGKAQKQFSDIRQEQLDQERRDHFIDNMWHRGLIVLIGIAAVAL